MGRSTRKFNFTKKGIDSLPPHPLEAKAREQEYSDQQVIGLRILVAKNSRKFFHLRYSFNHRKRIVSIGEYPALSVADARTRANEFKNMIASGVDPFVEKKKQSSRITFKEFGENEYMPFAKESKKSWKDDLLKLEKDLYPALGKLPLHAIAARDIQKCLTAVKARASAGTYNKYYSLTNRMFNLACQWEYLESNPCKYIKKLKEAGCRMRYLNNAEIKSLLSALDAYEKSPSADAVRYLLYTGFRMSEALKLCWKEVDLDAGTVFLFDTKSGESRTAVMNALAQQVLVDIKSRGGSNSYVFPGRYGKGRLMSPKRVFEAVKKAASIEDFTIHCLRHTFASLAINRGASLYSIKTLLGHHSISMTERYAHLADKGLRAATDTVAEQIGQAVK